MFLFDGQTFAESSIRFNQQEVVLFILGKEADCSKWGRETMVARAAVHLLKGSCWVVGGVVAISTTSHPAFGASCSLCALLDQLSGCSATVFLIFNSVHVCSRMRNQCCGCSEAPSV